MKLNRSNGGDIDRRGGPRRTFKYALVVAGLVLGIWVAAHFGAAAGTLLSEMRRLTAVMNLINSTYVEKPDLNRLSEGAIEGMLKRLDPHSIYIPSAEHERLAELDIGEFEGIGISFVIQNELITVIAPIIGTPAERLGIRSGDRIIEIDGVSAYGITNDEVFKKLRGPKGTTVQVKVLREGIPEPLDFTIVRDNIPIHSVWTSFMLDDSTGYILVNQFTANTTSDLEAALDRLEAAGMTRLVLDLRNNQGGRLSQAVAVADMFIPGGQVIVSRRGRLSAEDSTYRSTDPVTHRLFDLIVLINSGSASASEIVAGAVQDLDRGLIVGQNSFGKGLVQKEVSFKDGGVIRLSTAHWFTPSGRLVQRPYDKGRGEYYAVRYRDPEEVPTDGEREVFKTLGGRSVYASSGVAPDVEVEDLRITGATARLLSARLLFAYAQTMMQRYGTVVEEDFPRFQQEFEVTDDDIKGLLDMARDKDIEYPPEVLEPDRSYLSTQLKAELAQLLWSDRDYYYTIRTGADPVIKRARELFEQAQEVAAVWH